MKTIARPSTLAVLALLLLPLLAGCQGKELGAAYRLHTATLNYLTAERQAGHIADKTQAEVIAPAREASKAILDAWNDAYVSGQPFDWRDALRRFTEQMGPLLRQQEVLQEKSHGVPTAN